MDMETYKFMKGVKLAIIICAPFWACVVWVMW